MLLGTIVLYVVAFMASGGPRSAGATDLQADAPAPEAVPTPSHELSVLTLDTMVISASRVPHPWVKIPGAIDIVSRTDIEETHADEVVDTINHLPGVHVDQPGARGSRASVFVRGLDPNHTLVMIDGVVVNDPTNARGGSFDFSTLGVDLIDRVEVVRGPLSAVYGSDAIAGAINIITETGEGPDRVRLDVSGGRWGYVRTLGEVRGERGPLDLALSGSWVDGGVPSDLGSFTGGNVYANFGAKLPHNANVRSMLRFSNSDSESFPEFSGGTEAPESPGFEARDVNELSGGVKLEQNRLAGAHWLEGNLFFTTNQRWEDRSSPGVAPGPSGDFVPAEPDTHDRYERYSLSAVVSAYPPVAGLSLTAGGEATFDHGSSRGDLEFFGMNVPGGADFELERWVGGPFAEGYWASDFGLTILSGVRVDFPESRPAETSPRVGATYTLLNTGLKAEASWGEGFKLPSFYALATPTVGNRDLATEKSRGWDAGISWVVWDDRFTVSATYFDVEVKNLIDFNPDSFKLENIARARSQGVELETALQPFTTLELRAQATYADAINKIDDAPLRSRPKWRASFQMRWTPLKKVTAYFAGLFVDNVPDASIPTGPVVLDDYQRFDLAITWQALDWLAPFIAIDNIADQHYQQAVGFPDPGIRPRVGITVRWDGA